MFQGKRMITRGVADTIPPEVQMFLWSLLDELVAKMAEEPDYLQVFEFYGENGNQTIIHRQENPPYQAIYQFDKVVNPLQHKIYVIDDVEHCTMLLNDEY
ncbi:DUF960 domain-containing protein [Sporomusa acidovorans]|nr:DUF960 domain-containing protein [Sporomusa acidovorans]